MARISKTDHSRILQMVDGEHRRVAEVAAEFGCTPANIYTLLSKLRRNAPAPAELEPAIEAADTPAPAEIAAPRIPDLFAVSDQTAAPEPIRSERRPPQKRAAPAVAPESAPPAVLHEATVTTLPVRSVSKKGAGLGASLAKPGFGLVMRTPEGEENLTPFRSLDDLLSAVKPILRAAARSPDAVWFSIQPVDLASLDSDAA